MIKTPEKNSGMAAVFVLMMVDGLHFVFARMLLPHVSPEISAFYVLLIGTIEVGIYTLVTGKLHLSTFKKNIWVFLLIGFLVATSTNINYEAVAFVDAGTASLLNEVSIIFGLLFGLMWLKEKFSTPQLWGSLLAIAGVFVINYQSGDYLRLGSLMILCGSFMYAAHAAITKRYASEINLGEFFFFRLLSTSTFLFLFSLGRGALALPKAEAWPYLILAATVDIGISRTLYYVALRKLNVSFLSVLLTLSPVVTILWSLLLFGETPGKQQLIGGAAVIAGVMLVTYYRYKKSEKKIEPKTAQPVE